MNHLTRRSVLAASAALAACAKSSPPDNAMRAERHVIRGKELYVEIGGPAEAPALIYLHGGPGAGSYDFSFTQGARLSQRVRLIVLDQRGVLRSAPLAENEPCTLADLVEDTEALREALGLRSWSVVGHSFGGFLGLSYALAYPNSVERVIFENPSVDLDSSARELMRGAAEIYARLGDQQKAHACLDAASAPTPPRQTWDRFGELVNNMPGRDDLYVHGPNKNFFGHLVETSGIPGENWSRGGTHQQKLFEDDAVFQSLKPRFAELSKPSLLIHGAFDRVTAPDQIEAFSAGRDRTLTTFENSAHFAHYEEQERFAQTVADFVLSA